MLYQLLRFEVLYQRKQRSFIIFSIIFMLYGFMICTRGYTPNNVDVNSAYQLSYNCGLATLGSMFVIMFFSVSGVIRDKTYLMESLIYSTSVKKYQFFISRFLGVFIFSLVAFSMMLSGFLFGTLFSGLDPDQLAPFDITSYLWPWLIMIIPNIFICTSIIFSVSMLTKNNIATYVSAVFIYLFYFISAIYLNSPLMASAVPASPESLAIAALADPFGISAFFEQVQYWTPFQKNTERLSFTGYFMWNRLVWFFISLGILMVTYRLFSFRTLHQKAEKKIDIYNEQSYKSRVYQPIEAFTGRDFQFHEFFALLKLELKGVFKSLPFLAIMLCWLVIVITEIYSRIYQGGAYNDSWYPSTNLLIDLFIEPLPLLGLVLIIFYSGELVWRERSLNFNGIIDATPASNTVFFLSKFVVLVLLPAFLIGSAIIVGLVFQLMGGYYRFEIKQYLSVFYYHGAGLFFFCLLALFVQSIVRNKYFGMIITGLIILLLGSTFANYIGIEHPLLRVGAMPQPSYTNMNGYLNEAKFHHFAIYWLAFGGILSLMSFKLWQRGAFRDIGFRLKQLLFNWKKWQMITFVALAIIFISSGAIIFYNINIVNEYTTIAENLDHKESYEKKFKKYDALERLYPSGMKTKVDIYPNENRYEIKANYILKNRSAVPVNQAFITERIPLKAITFEKASLIEYDTVFGTYLFQFDQPLRPNEEVRFSYELVKRRKGYESDQAIVNNGSYIFLREFEPVLGYQTGMEITDDFERKKRGLPKREEEKSYEDHLQPNDRKVGKVDYESFVSTESGQVAIAPGDLLAQWTTEGRNYYHYKALHKISPSIAYLSANYKTKTDEYEGISIEQYYHQGHDFNIEKIARNTKQTLAYCIKNFGHYPFNHIRIAEIPGHWGFGGVAHPGTISMVEDRLYLIDVSNPDVFDLVAKRTIHEVAHQWWGGILAPKFSKGGSILVEGLAKYTEAVIMEKTIGKSAIWQLSESANKRYFSGRSYATEPEPPLYLVDGQAYLPYGKNYTVMLALKELIGEEMVNKVLKIMTDRHKDDIDLTATAMEFLEELYKVTPENQHTLIDDWFRRVITYDLSVESASYRPMNNGQYEITVTVRSKRFETEDSGEAIIIDIDEPISIGIFTKHPREIIDEKAILYYKSHQINKEQMEFNFVVNELPQYIGIDPYGTRSDKNLSDNLRKL